MIKCNQNHSELKKKTRKKVSEYDIPGLKKGHGGGTVSFKEENELGQMGIEESEKGKDNTLYLARDQRRANQTTPKATI